jgi:heme-degrading monooxygenase HmoA
VYVVISRFTIANDMVEPVRLAFRNRPHLVDSAPGFIRLEVMSPADQPEEVWLSTYWQDEQSYHVWHKSHAYHQSHSSIPKGLKLVPRSAEIRCFEMFAD